jgi:hypothetical protein
MSAKGTTGRKWMLRGIVALVASAGGVLQFLKRESITRRNPFLGGDYVELCGRDLSKREDWSFVAFGDPLQFGYTGDVITATAYSAVTFSDGRACAGRYEMQATFEKGYTGGPAGSATEYFVTLDNIHLVERLKRPEAPPGVRAILPGECIIRPIADGELQRLDDKYVIDLPADRHATIVFVPFPEDCEFVVTVAHLGRAFGCEFGGETFGDTGFHFDTTTAGLYEIRVRASPEAMKIPDHYDLHVIWGDSLGLSGFAGENYPKFKPKRTQAPPGARIIMHRELIVRPIADGELEHLDDKYMIDLPANKHARIVFAPWPENYAFRVTVTQSGLPLASEFKDQPGGFPGFDFLTTIAGPYEIRVRSSPSAQRIPDHYDLDVVLEDSLSDTGGVNLCYPKFKPAQASSSGESSSHEPD